MKSNHSHDKDLLDQVERLLADETPAQSDLLNDMAGTTPQANPHFQKQLEGRLLAKMQARQTPERKPITMQAAVPYTSLPAQRSPFKVSLPLVAALIAVALFGAILAFIGSQQPDDKPVLGAASQLEATLTATPISTVTPVAPPQEIQLGVTEGELTAEQPFVTYSFIAPEAGLLYITLEAEGFINLIANNNTGITESMQLSSEVRDMLLIYPPTAIAPADITMIPVPGTPFDQLPSAQIIISPAPTLVPGGVASQDVMTITTAPIPFTAAELKPLRDSVLYVESGDFITVTVSGEAGTFTLDLSYPEAAPAAYGDETQGSLTEDKRYAIYSFEGNAGDLASVSVEGENGLDTQLMLAGRGNNSRLSIYDYDSGSGMNPEIFQWPLQADGTYWVVVFSDTPVEGNFILLVTNG
jgi:hypothetical protein